MPFFAVFARLNAQGLPQTVASFYAKHGLCQTKCTQFPAQRAFNRA